MQLPTQVRLVGLIAAVLLAGCAPQAPGASSRVGEAERVGPPKRVTAAILADPPALAQALQGFGTRGVTEVEEMINSGLTATDQNELRRPVLAETVPTTDNGLWRVFPDGRMETRWKIRSNSLWHDGTPFTAEDLVFTAKIAQDKDLPLFASPSYNFVDSVEAPDAATIVVHWKQPYIDADGMFSGPPRPRRLLEETYLTNKPGLLGLPYWAEEYVGTGPFKVREFVRGSHVLLEANERYVLGRPKLDELEVKFIPDPNTIVANVLAGTVSLTIGKTISVEQALEVIKQWKEGRIENAPANFISAFPQMMDPNPPIILNPQFRRAMLYAIDRQELVDTLLGGLGPGVAHTFTIPKTPDYEGVEGRIPRYEYDPRRAAQMLEGLGYSKGPDGLYRDSRDQQLSVEIRTYTVDINQKATLAVADTWQRLGVAVTPNVMSPQAATNNEYIHTFPSFLLQRYLGSTLGFTNVHSSRTPLPSNNYRSGNLSRYVNPEFDTLIDRYYTTIPLRERAQIAEQILHHMADIVYTLGLIYDVEPHLMATRLVNVYATTEWNSHEWDLS